MGIEDRDWLRHDRERRAKLVWNDKSGEMEFDRLPPKRRWRWPYRLRPDLPYWVREWVRAVLFFGALALMYLAWTLIRG
jgi:hypothetical protein